MVSTALSHKHVMMILKIVTELVNGFKTTIYADRCYVSQSIKDKFNLQKINLVIYYLKNMK